jgi:hypothetical protein
MIQRHYKTWDDSLTDSEHHVYLELYPVNWKPPSIVLGPLPEPLPRTFEERRSYAYTLYVAMLDFETGFIDSHATPGNTRPNPLFIGQYEQAYVQARCYEVIEKLVKLHSIGAMLNINRDPTYKKIEVTASRAPPQRAIREGDAWYVDDQKVVYERELSFEDRFTELCISVTHFKNVAKDLLNGVDAEKVIYSPVNARQSKLDNAYNNEKKSLQGIIGKTRMKNSFDLFPLEGAIPRGGSGNAKRPSQQEPPLPKTTPPAWASGPRFDILTGVTTPPPVHPLTIKYILQQFLSVMQDQVGNMLLQRALRQLGMMILPRIAP